MEARRITKLFMFLCFVVLNFTLCEAEVIILQILIIVKNFLEFFEIFHPSLTHVLAIPLDAVGENTAVTLLNTATWPLSIDALIKPNEHDVLSYIVLLTSGYISIPQRRAVLHHAYNLLTKVGELRLIEDVGIEDVVVHVV